MKSASKSMPLKSHTILYSTYLVIIKLVFGLLENRQPHSGLFGYSSLTLISLKKKSHYLLLTLYFGPCILKTIVALDVSDLQYHCLIVLVYTKCDPALCYGQRQGRTYIFVGCAHHIFEQRVCERNGYW